MSSLPLKPNETLFKVLEFHLNQYPNKVLYRFLSDGEKESDSRTYLQLYNRSRIVASRILEQVAPGGRVLLLYPSGLEFIDAFFGCLIAGVIAVPVFPPHSKRCLGRLENTVSDCGACLVLATNEVYTKSYSWFCDSVLKEVPWIETDTLEGFIGKIFPVIRPNTIAFLQYTSGSTGKPKGIILDHSNLIHNSELYKKCFRIDSDSIGVSWLPVYHDMGLIGNIIEALYVGFELIFMPPIAFVQKPIRWLGAISRYKGTITCGSNFAYDLCANQIQNEDLEDIDLSSLSVAINGSEPIHPVILEKFSSRFEPYGFKTEALFSGYDLAEVALTVSGSMFKTSLKVLELNRESFNEKNTRVSEKAIADPDMLRLVSNGPVAEGLKAKIVDPDTKRVCKKNEIGELWIDGPRVAKGYWKKKKLTKETFRAYTHYSTGKINKKHGPYLRTGDMGFISDGELYISGRLKEMSIINGVNNFPGDTERAVRVSH